MKKIITIISAALFLASFSLVLAETTTNTETTATDCGNAPTAPAAGATAQERQAYRQELQKYNQCKKDQLKEQRQKNIEDKCKLVGDRITERLNNFQNKQNSDTTIFGNVKGRLDNLAVRLKNKGLDTSKLETDLKTLADKITKVNTDYASVISSLKDTENFTCGNSQGQFMGKLGAARSILMAVRQDRLAVKEYIKNTIRPDILALRQQLVKTENKQGIGATEPQ
ncbi:MAG: hypothetical protein NTZ97_03925 [Candidatus Moranbacteria bacterium]|nr:hypothetical protein [Candidatus Moranbacteria bacterium]